MRKRVGIMFVAVLSLMMVSASSNVSNGIEFDHLTLAKAKAEAVKTGKLIFIDCYTDWCGPCKRMAATAFKDEKVGDLYNNKFLNLKIEMEKNPDGKSVAAQYKIRAYPTLLIIDGKGNLIKQVVGMQSADGLMAFGRSVQ